MKKRTIKKRLIGRRVSVKIEHFQETGSNAARKEVLKISTVIRKAHKKNSDVALAHMFSGLFSVE